MPVVSIPNRPRGRLFSRSDELAILERFERGESILLLAIAFNALVIHVEEVIRRAYVRFERHRAESE